MLVMLFWALPFAPKGEARTLYGVSLTEESIDKALALKLAKEEASHPLLSEKTIVDARERPRPFQDKSMDFLIVLGLVLAIAVFRLANPYYFRNLFRAFRNPSLSMRQLKDQLSQNTAASILLDILFCVSIGTYTYFALAHLHDQRLLPAYPEPLVILAFVLLFIMIYTVRFIFLKFTGWVFGISEIMDSYTFNIFLINKILGIIIVPFTAILAFGNGPWVGTAFLLSLITIGILFMNRYLRSGVTFGYFLKFSKFHFFMYLCASEILPLAVLMKLVNQWLVS